MRGASIRRERGFSRAHRYPAERDWERSDLLEPQAAGYEPDLVSDGSGLPFPPSALDLVGRPLDADDPAVQALLAQLARRKAEDLPQGLEGWRRLARTDDAAIFAHGRLPHLTTMSLSRDGKRGTWRSLALSSGKQLRTTRDGVRASGWRRDPSQARSPQDTVLRVLVTEQTRAGGQRAHGRLLPPDLHVTDDELILTMFVTPRPGFQLAASAPETVARVVLPVAIGERSLVDGALYAAEDEDDAET